MPAGDLTDWLDEYSGPEFVWYVKRLSGNDTLANTPHQAGPYIPREFLFGIFPSLERRDEKNPDVRFDLYVDSQADTQRTVAALFNPAGDDRSREAGRCPADGAGAAGRCLFQMRKAVATQLRVHDRPNGFLIVDT